MTRSVDLSRNFKRRCLSKVRYTSENKFALIVLDNPPINALSLDLRRGLAWLKSD
jgi:hypothetical protein